MARPKPAIPSSSLPTRLGDAEKVALAAIAKLHRYDYVADFTTALIREALNGELEEMTKRVADARPDRQ